MSVRYCRNCCRTTETDIILLPHHRNRHHPRPNDRQHTNTRVRMLHVLRLGRTNRGNHVRICKHCGVRIELIECADGYDRWMHKQQRYSPPIPPSIYLECDLPRSVATP